MLNVSIAIGQIQVDLPSLSPGDTGSFTDHTDNTLIIFICNDDDGGASVQRSMRGVHEEVNDIRIIKSLDLRIEMEIEKNQSFKLDFKHKRGPATLLLEHAST